MKKVLVFGGTGFIGTSLANHLKSKDYKVVVIGRKKPVTSQGRFVSWDGMHLGEWTKELDGCTAIVNLAGKSVDCIKTPDNCDLILRSRVHTTELIGKALKQTKAKPKVWVQMSTAHIYGDPPTMLCTEDSPTGYGLAPFVGKAWESAFAASKPEETRGVILRTSFVLGKHGGALVKLKQIAKMGLGGKVGTGKQGLSWIHEEDMNRLFEAAIENDNYSGAYIASAPNPVSNKEFMKQLRKGLRVPIGLPTPAFLVELGTKLVFKTDPELALYGRYVKSERLNGLFTFSFPDLEEAFRDLLNG